MNIQSVEYSTHSSSPVQQIHYTSIVPLAPFHDWPYLLSTFVFIPYFPVLERFNHTRIFAPHMSDQLKIMALDALDLAVVSAHVQDAVLKGGEIEYSVHKKQLVLPINRFAWEAKSARRGLFRKYERRRSVLHFARVESVKTKGIDRHDKAQILSLLAITFSPGDHGDDPSGTLEFTFAGNAAMSVQIECIEAQLSDLGAAWTARGKPRHIPSSGG